MAKISNQNVALAIYKSLKDKAGAHAKEALTNVVNFLARRRLLSQTSDILNRLQRIIDQQEGAVRVKVSSAKPLGTHLKYDLVKKLEHRYRVKEIIFNEQVDEKLIGGLKLEISDEVIDLTIKNKIRKLEEHLKA